MNKLIKLFAATLLCVSSISIAVSQPGRPRVELNALATRGEALANEDPLALELRNQQPEGPGRRGFDIGMGAAEGHTEPGPGKQRIHDVLLSPYEQPGYKIAVAFSIERNRYADRAKKGAAIAEADAEVAEARKGKRDVFYKLGFDIATAIFGDPALGAQGNTSMGPGARGIRDSLSAMGQLGFNHSMNFNLTRRGISINGPTLPADSNQIKVGPKIGNTTPEPEYRELRCRGRYGMSIKVGDWPSQSAAGEPMKQMIVNFNLIDKPTNNWGLNLRPGDCAYVDTPGKVLGVGELHQVIVAFGQLRQKLNGSNVDTSPAAAERFPDAQNVPEYLQDSNHYWSFFVKYTGRGYFEASSGKFWKPAPPLRATDKVKFLTKVISEGRGQTEPKERPRRPSRVNEQSSLQKEKISEIKSPIALEAARRKNGALKAMLFIDRNGQIVRCFNSLLVESENSKPPCGLKVERISTDDALKVYFEFQVNDRFVLTTPVITGARFNSESASSTTAPFTFHPDESNVIVVLLSRPETALMIFVY